MKSGLPIDVRALLAPDGVESLRVEYKAEWNHVCGSSAIHTICAFANDLVNAGGGYVVIGVEERDGRPLLPPRGVPVDRLDAIQKEIQGQINRIKPSYGPMIVPERVGDVMVLVIYCPGGDGRPYEAPETLAAKAPYHSYVRTSSQTREARGELLHQLREVSTSVPFDDRACYEASVDDLDPALLQHHLQTVGSRLAADRTPFVDRARQLQLLRRTNGHEVPRNVALLFFSQDPRRWFRGAGIEIAQLPQGRSGEEIRTWTVEGPLPSQIRQALAQLRGLMPAELRKHADRAEADRIEAWPFAAVEEALVNAVHHRGYASPDPIKVTLLPDALEIVSYPGPMPGLSLADVQSGRSRPVPARNRRIAELLKDLRLAEARGTGLERIRREMSRNGSPPPVFEFDEESRSYFQVRLPIHPAFLRHESAPRLAQPLRIGRPAPAAEVVGRDALIQLVLRMLKNQSVLLVGPRGRGVSSLMGAVAARLDDARIFQLDLTGVSARGFWAALTTWAEREGGRALKSDAELMGFLENERVMLVLDNLGAFGAGGDWSDVEHHQGEILTLLGQHPQLRVLASLQHPSELHERREGPGWESWSDMLPVPPLDRASSIELSLRLLAGSHLPEDAEVAEALAELSAGIPELIVRVIGQLHVRQVLSADAARSALDALCARKADPTGLRSRVSSFRAQLEGGHRSSISTVAAALLNVVAAGAPGRRRLDLIASAVSAGHDRLDVLHSLTELELEGWLVEVDGEFRFEHPWIRDAWNAHSKSATAPGRLPYQDDDIPF